MKAALLETPNQPLNICNIDNPKTPRDGVVISVTACGVCRSDWHGWRGTDPDITLPHIPGHEFAGVVVDVGPECKNFKRGDRVTAPVILGCGACPTCRTGEYTVCDKQFVVGFTGWGAFAEYVAVPYADPNIVQIPDNVPFDVAAALGCRFTTAYRGIVDRARLMPGEIIAIHGCGGIGLSAVMISAAIGATVIAIDIVDDKLELAKSLGATHSVNAAKTLDTGAAVVELSNGGAHVSLDALGITNTFHNSLRSLRKLGRHVQLGQPLKQHAEPMIPLLETVYSRQLSVMGSRGLPAHRFSSIFEMIESKKLNPQRLINRRIGLEDISGVFEQMNKFEDCGITIVDKI